MQKESVLIIVGILVVGVLLLSAVDWLEITGKANEDPSLNEKQTLDEKELAEKLKKYAEQLRNDPEFNSETNPHAFNGAMKSYEQELRREYNIRTESFFSKIRKWLLGAKDKKEAPPAPPREKGPGGQ